MQLLLSSHAVLWLPTEEAFSIARKLSFDGIELVLDPRALMLGKKKLRLLSEQYNMPIMSVHQPIWHFPYTARHMLRRLVRYASAMGAHHVVVHGSVFRVQNKRRIFSLVRELEREYGVTIGIENGHVKWPEFPPRWTWEADRFGSFIEEHNFNVTLDVPKFDLGGEDPVSFFLQHKESVPAIHLHGRRGRTVHLPLHESERLTRSFLAALNKAAFSGSVTLEVFPLRQYRYRPMSGEQLRAKVVETLSQDVAFVRDIIG